MNEKAKADEELYILHDMLRDASLYLFDYIKRKEKEKFRSLFTLVCNEENNDDDAFITSKEYKMLINLPGVSLSPKPRKDGRYQGYVTIDEERFYAYGGSVRDVAEQLKNFLRFGAPERKKKAPATVQQKTQERASTSVMPGVPTTFDSFSKYYFENFRSKSVSKRTLQIDTVRYNRYLKPYFKEIDLRNVTPKLCQDLIERVKKTGKTKTAEEIYSLLSVILKMAIKHGILTQNPLAIVLRVNHEGKHGSALTKEEEKKLIDELFGDETLPAFMLALYTGLRPNELKTAKVDGDFIVAVNSKRKNHKIEYKKIPICKMLRPFIKGKSIYIPGTDRMRRIIRTILPGHILYDLRTTFYSRLKECNVSEHAIKAFMGHSLGALGNAYTDLSDEFLLKEIEKFCY